MTQSEDCPSGLLAFAAELVEHLEARTIPEGFDWSQPYPLAQAGLRHEATNHDELLDRLSSRCMGCMEKRRPFPCPCADGDELLSQAAYALIRTEAHDLARALYEAKRACPRS